MLASRRQCLDHRSLAMCSGLNVCVLPNSYVGMIMPKLVALVGGTFGSD